MGLGMKKNPKIKKKKKLRAEVAKLKREKLEFEQEKLRAERQQLEQEKLKQQKKSKQVFFFIFFFTNQLRH